jgi:S-adenosylmethionine-diacylgycerolhomoserine-N-methlytransferase
MDRIYRTQRYVYDLTRRPYLIGRSALIAGLQPPWGGHVLEIGCGTAWNLIRAAKRYPLATFYGLDISSAMLETARRSIQRHDLASRIFVAKADATAFNAAGLFGRAAFDRVFISYALSMIPEWRRVVEQAIDMLAHDGALHLVDFGQCEGLPAEFKRLLFAWLAQFSVMPLADFEAEIANLTRLRGIACRVTRPYHGYAVSAVLVPTA